MKFEQLSMFDELQVSAENPEEDLCDGAVDTPENVILPLKIDKPVKLIELFGGIGAQAAAFERLDKEGLLPYGFEHHVLCEFDKYAVSSYNAVHHTDFAVSDITQLHAEDLHIEDTDKYLYVMCYSFPCQDISLAGKQRGYSEESGSRSSLLWEVRRLLEECDALGELPQILLMENVPAVHNTKNRENWDKWLRTLTELGYDTRWADLNAKDFGVPQNRNRTFAVSWNVMDMGERSYTFPKGFPLEKRLKDVLEKDVAEKYYLSDEAVAGLVKAMDRPTTRP